MALSSKRVGAQLKPVVKVGNPLDSYPDRRWEEVFILSYSCFEALDKLETGTGLFWFLEKINKLIELFVYPRWILGHDFIYAKYY
jgi:hypothetical protein